ncbi:lamin tail domain-containing protein [Nocardiopsis lambiniae]|uniref:Lamin tail domain-containing protein n=1 Tax=Nocardiopsis lambiniae TaxID=3075539 RepID=A0ABU2M325_9ACTN|nr:lamin tail domain-containing protein [Nocardiopsis sp. DSM 44743]MDT0327046.1 lamin tail domain-containing protein [Nocardiopsis sp. DSM 44743]
MARKRLRSALIAAAALATLVVPVPAQAASTTGALMITHVRPNAAGADIKNNKQVNLNGEYFILKNVTKKTVDLGGYVPDITTNTYGRALPAYRLPAGAKVYVHTGSGTHHRDAKGNHHVYRGYGRHVLPNDGTKKNPDIRLKKPGSRDDNTATGAISSCNWGKAADGRTYAC